MCITIYAVIVLGFAIPCHKAHRDRILVHGRATAQVELLADALADALDLKDQQPEAASRFRDRVAARMK